jgi:N-acetylglucosaminyldiphosphoundecaprenol N-acetyl-beta-D-mannosaminyltransferase
MRNADLVLADCLPLIRLTRLFGPPLPARLKGADLFPVLIREAARRRQSLFLLGPDPASVKTVEAKLRACFPEVVIAGSAWADPVDLGTTSPATGQDYAICQRINQSKADFLVVGFGTGHLKQERWLQRNLPLLRVPVTVALGGIFQLYANSAPPPPCWIGACHLGWCHELLCQPSQFWKSRINDWFFLSLLSLPWLAMMAAVQLWNRHRLRTAAPPEPRQAVRELPSARGRFLTLQLPPRFDRAAVEAVANRLIERLAGASAILIDARELLQLDAAGIGFLATLHGDCRRRAIAFFGFGLRQTPTRLLKAARAWDLLADRFLPNLAAVAARLREEWGTFCLAALGQPEPRGAAVLRIFGYFQEPWLEAVRERLADAWNGNVRELDIDLLGCVEMDAAARALLDQWRASFAAAGRQLRLVAVPPQAAPAAP